MLENFNFKSAEIISIESYFEQAVASISIWPLLASALYMSSDWKMCVVHSICQCDLCFDFVLICHCCITSSYWSCVLQSEKHSAWVFHFSLLVECDLNFHKSCLEKIIEQCLGRKSAKSANMFDKLIKKPSISSAGKTHWFC